MKFSSHTSKTTLAGLLSVMFVFVSISTAHAQILLTINDSTPDAVVITATGTYTGTSIANGGSFNNGIDLLQFFTNTMALVDNPYSISPTNLSTGDSSKGPALDYAYNDDYSYKAGSTSLIGVDLNLLTHDGDPGSGNTMTFTYNDAAFSGSLTVNLSGTFLPAVGASGQIITGFYGNGSNGNGTGSPEGTPNYIVGEWQVVPEPSSGALMLVCVTLMVVLRWRLFRA